MTNREALQRESDAFADWCDRCEKTIEDSLAPLHEALTSPTDDPTRPEKTKAATAALLAFGALFRECPGGRLTAIARRIVNAPPSVPILDRDSKN